MKTILTAGASLMTSLRWAFMGLSIATLASSPALAGTIGITFSNSGSLTGPPVFNGTILTLDSLATGSILSFDPTLNTIWNPVTFHIQDFVDVTTGVSNGGGTFGITFANGDMLSGNFSQVLSPAILATNAGPFTEILTVTGGTGQFVGAFGSISGAGVAAPTGFTTSGGGTLTAAGVAVPEPASVMLVFGGLLVMVATRKVRPRCAGPVQRHSR
jgi:hypothetical protein